MSCLLGVPCRGHHRPHIGGPARTPAHAATPWKVTPLLWGAARGGRAVAYWISDTKLQRDRCGLMLAEKAPSPLVRVGHHRDGDASPLLFRGAAVIEGAHPDLLHPGEFHTLRFEEPPDGFDAAL